MTQFFYQYPPPTDTTPMPVVMGIAINGVSISGQNVAIQGNVVVGMAMGGQQIYANDPVVRN